MNKVAEIKHKVEWSSYHGDISANEVEGDIQYLLSKLEIAEKALEDAKDKTTLAVNKMCGGNAERHVFEDTRAAYYSIKEALQKIRE